MDRLPLPIYRFMRARPSYLSAFVPRSDDFTSRQNRRCNAILVDVLPPANLRHFSQDTIANELANRFGGYPNDFHVARYSERDYVLFLPEWDLADAIGRENPPNGRADQHIPHERSSARDLHAARSDRGRCSSDGGDSNSDASWNSSEIRDRRRAMHPFVHRGRRASPARIADPSRQEPPLDCAPLLPTLLLTSATGTSSGLQAPPGSDATPAAEPSAEPSALSLAMMAPPLFARSPGCTPASGLAADVASVGMLAAGVASTGGPASLTLSNLNSVDPSFCPT
uniref:Uncharacterized protein n=1 Tax=Ananas comosus var. bracteatus TaxID=296719 RepID=A0A6V7QLY9_ANACO|nr:unnamed protein product [Ananas comosus var. bracteatus]